MKYQKLKSLEVSFEQTKILKDMQIELKSSGVLKLEPPNKVEWKITKPQPLTVRLDKDRIAITSDGKTETFKTGEGPTAKDRRNFEDLLNWLSLDAHAIAKNYSVTKLGERNFRFQAKRPDATIRDMTMTLNKNGHVDLLKFDEASGDQISIRFATPKVK